MIFRLVPEKRGMGSSAAVAIAKIVVLIISDQELNQETFEMVHQAETIAHCKPSGLDVVNSLEWPSH